MSKVKEISIEAIVSQVEGNIVSDMDGEKVMLSVQNGKYYNLGSLGGEIWELMKEPISIQLLVSKLMDMYDVEPQECVEHTIAFIGQLIEEGLVQVQE
ncbi:lasso peptide biosynthesis PqqD family chaperone [Aquibacillus albus]|uniref:Lasso peptide biosynthesis PqqD family chaperone n=1 Tax=Aquibacillus albus TaxID=1168171 RepID=A0ABS2N5W0_9BACI|nr:lasso peptide biosynthesis PqqD family chaperone [Aquibacillus albus]MBM7573493.1 hypothetical protein [Aquibacillus albus]